MWYWTAAVILILVNSACVLANLFMLPGNWLMLGALCIFLLATDAESGPAWGTVLVTGGLAVLGEILETFGGGAQAAKLGASRRAILLSLVVSIVGSIAGTVLVPIPVVGTAVGAVLGAAGGAWVGAWIGEAWVGADHVRRTKVGNAAMTGRVMGMMAKLAIGVAIFVTQLVSLWL